MLRVGEVAERTGLSVRTLHHYDEIGLLPPGDRSAGGHRLYGLTELRRLQWIRSLKQLGFSLEETRGCLDDPRFSFEGTLRLHRSRLDGHLERTIALRDRLARLERLVRAGDLTVEDVLKTIEETTMIEKYYTSEQIEQLAARREEWGEEKIEAVQNRWADLARRVYAAMSRGLDPESQPVRELAREWRELTAETVAGFTAGDAGIGESPGRMWSEEKDMGSQWEMGPEVRGFIGKAIAAL